MDDVVLITTTQVQMFAQQTCHLWDLREFLHVPVPQLLQL